MTTLTTVGVTIITSSVGSMGTTVGCGLLIWCLGTQTMWLARVFSSETARLPLQHRSLFETTRESFTAFDCLLI